MMVIMVGDHQKKGKSLLLCLLLGVFLIQESVTLAMARKGIEGSLDEQKSYYPPDSHGRSHPRHHSHKRPSYPTPSSGASGGATPSHGGGGYYSPPPTSTITDPPTPSHGGGGYYSPSPAPSITPSPTSTNDPVIPTPLVPFPPSTPTPPAIPFDPHSPPFTCDYWKLKPAAIWGLFGLWGTIDQCFGPLSASSFGRNLSLLEALGNTRSDGIGALYREGTASLLNSMASKTFIFTPQQVRDAFRAALVSDEAAAAQAQLFKQANEGHLKHY